MNLRVRSAEPADRAVVHALLTAQLIEHDLPADRDRIDRGLDAAFRRGSPAWLVLAERNGKPVGVLLANQIVSVEAGGESLWIEELYVIPEARRAGVARAILTHVLEEARRRGLRALDLEVVRTQAAALALYRAAGFREVARDRLTLDL
jgi:ribosomal protein S18 acetylase RimI-like enzyme